MEQVKCTKCGGATKLKQITAKATGKTFTVLECLQEKGECLKEGTTFAFSFFPPKKSDAKIDQVFVEIQKLSDKFDQLSHVITDELNRKARG